MQTVILYSHTTFTNMTETEMIHLKKTEKKET